MTFLIAWVCAAAMLGCGVWAIASAVCHDGVIAPAWPIRSRVAMIWIGGLMIALFLFYVIIVGPIVNG